MKPSSAFTMTAALAILLLPSLAMAQSNSDSTVPVLRDNPNIRLKAGGLLPKKEAPGLPDVRGPAQAWPRLERGAVLCRSEADLSRLNARRHGQAVDGPVDCQVLRSPTGITIVRREGPGMTQVQTTNPAAGGNGWTDAWLPDHPPGH
jgi:hypothetical protein